MGEHVLHNVVVNFLGKEIFPLHISEEGKKEAKEMKCICGGDLCLYINVINLPVEMGVVI